MLFFRLFLSDIIQYLIYEERSVIRTFQHAFRLCFPVHAGEEPRLLVLGHPDLLDGRAEKPAPPALAGGREGAMVITGMPGCAKGN